MMTDFLTVVITVVITEPCLLRRVRVMPNIRWMTSSLTIPVSDLCRDSFSIRLLLSRPAQFYYPFFSFSFIPGYGIPLDPMS